MLISLLNRNRAMKLSPDSFARNALQIAVVACALIWQCANALAEDCYNGTLRQRFDACTAIIDDPTTPEPTRTDARVARALMHSELGRYPDAIADMDKVIADNPDWAYALNGRAWFKFEWKRSTEGMVDVERALQLEPRSGPYWDTRAHLRQVLGDFEGAFADYETAVGFGGVDMIRMYQCGLSKRGLYKGKIDGIYAQDVRAALKSCAFSSSCDPLPNIKSTPESNQCDETVT
jgi:tetratricopeptide (TPR) repeat protein